MSRLRFLFALAVLVAATALSACGGGDSSDQSPQAVVDGATLAGIESGEVDLSLAVKASGEEGGDLDVGLSGPFQSGGEGELPSLDLTAEASGAFDGEDVAFDGGLLLLPDTAYVTYEGVEYEVDPTTFRFVEAALKEGQRKEGGEARLPDFTACQEASGGLDLGDLFDNLGNDGAADVGGTSTTKVSGDLDVAAALDALVEVAEDPECSAQLGSAGPLPSAPAQLKEAKREVQGAVKRAHAELYVGDDGIVRRLTAQLTIEPEGSGKGPRRMEIDLDLTLTGVNEEQDIDAPEGEVKPLNDLFLKLGVNPIELLPLLEGDGGEGLGNLLEGLGGAGGGGGAGSLGDLLEGLGAGKGSGGGSGGSGGGGSSSGGGGGGGSSSGGGGRQAYLECIGEATTPADLQKCAQQL